MSNCYGAFHDDQSVTTEGRSLLATLLRKKLTMLWQLLLQIASELQPRDYITRY
jgi:hypothetical protein